jgi:hypothetical protein
MKRSRVEEEDESEHVSWKKKKTHDGFLECASQVLAFVQSKIKHKYITRAFVLPIIHIVYHSQASSTNIVDQETIAQEVLERVSNILQLYS